MSLLRPLIAATFLLATALPAAAGDAAARRVIGFSPDGTTFAFEQYTTLYDSLEHIVEIQVIETRTDTFVKGTPFRLRADESKKSHDLPEARNELMRKARPFVIGNLKVSEPGQQFAGKPSMDLDEIGIYQMDPKPLATGQDFTLPDGRKASLKLSETALGKASCYGAGGRATYGDVITQGVTLTLSLDGGAPVTLQSDKRLPKSRRCVTAYGIAEAWLHRAPDGVQTLAVLLETVDAHEFHAGPNRRFMAVTTRIPAAKSP